MKRILEIIERVGNDTIGLFELKEETTYNNMEIFINPDRRYWTRMEQDKLEELKEKDYRKVLASSLTSAPNITLRSSEIALLRTCLKDGTPFIEVDCDEKGYPILNDGVLVFYRTFKSPPITFSPAEALERIKQFNESYNNNHKLTPGLYESPE